MPVPLTRTFPVRTTPQQRAVHLAQRIADQLAEDQNPDGSFPQHDFYAKAFAIALWQRLDPAHYDRNITRALEGLRRMPKDRRYHREFIEFALRQAPGIDAQTHQLVLAGRRFCRPPVANWILLRILCQETGNWLSRQRAAWDWQIFKNFYVSQTGALETASDPALKPQSHLMIPDRKGSFSAQYHAFCAALLHLSRHRDRNALAGPATALVASLATPHGFPNLVGRGAGQSFGMASAVYALLAQGHSDTAHAVLDHLENAFAVANTLPLNIHAPAPLVADPGPANPVTPGWYSYNRHYDYLAFAGFFLHAASSLPPRSALQPVNRNGKSPGKDTGLVMFQGRNYQAYASLKGPASFDLSITPSVIWNGTVLLPPTGGEQDFKSLYDDQSVPMPIRSRDQACARLTGAQVTPTGYQVRFEIAECTGRRDVAFAAQEILLCDQIDGTGMQKSAPEKQIFQMFRLLIPAKLSLVQLDDYQFQLPQIGVQITSDCPLELEPAPRFSAFGPAQILFAPVEMTRGKSCRAQLHFRAEPS